MAKNTLLPTEFRLPELKLPKLDVDTLHAAQKANLAAVQEAQNVLLSTAQAIAKVQQDYVEQAVAEVKAQLVHKEPVRPEAVLAEAKAAVEKNVAVGKEVIDLAVAAQRQVGALFTQRTKASVDEFKALAA